MNVTSLHLADMHRRPIILLSNEYAYLRDNSVVASAISELAQTGEIDYVPVLHKMATYLITIGVDYLNECIKTVLPSNNLIEL